MISETMPLNEWPSVTLKHLEIDLRVAYDYWDKPSDTTKEMIKVVRQAIKDAEERESKLPY